MKTVFADTGYWVALDNPHDEFHAKAKVVSARLDPVETVTSEMVLTELLNDFGGRSPILRAAATQFVQVLARNPRATIVPQSSEQFQAALAIYANRLDKA